MGGFETTLRVRYAETDAMGIVHHSRYFVWLEIARIEWLRSLDLDYKAMEYDGFSIPVIQADLTYKSPAFFDDELQITLIPPTDLGNVRFTLNYLIKRNTTVLTQGFTVHVFLNKDRKLIQPPHFFIERLKAQ